MGDTKKYGSLKERSCKGILYCEWMAAWRSICSSDFTSLHNLMQRVNLEILEAEASESSFLLILWWAWLCLMHLIRESEIRRNLMLFLVPLVALLHNTIVFGFHRSFRIGMKKDVSDISSEKRFLVVPMKSRLSNEFCYGYSKPILPIPIICGQQSSFMLEQVAQERESHVYFVRCA